MTRPTILDRDDVAVVPVPIAWRWKKSDNDGWVTAWQEVREYVAGLERHVEELQAKIDPDTDCACSYDEPGTVCDAHSTRVRELERRLAEAERVIEPFASVTENDIGEDEDEYDDDVFRPISAKNARAQLINVGHLRAARAWREGK